MLHFYVIHTTILSVLPLRSVDWLTHMLCTYAVLQPWTPCLPIRGGKLKTSKNYSTSNPQLSFGCTPIASAAVAHNTKANNTTSSNSLNSSFIWREASPNNFNLYSTSVSSLNATNLSPYRYSIGTAAASGASGRSPADHYRAVSEEKSTSPHKKSNKYKVSSHHDNLPLLPNRKHKPIKILKSSQENVYLKTVGKRLSNDTDDSGDDRMPYALYDRRVNRSFETPSRDMMMDARDSANGAVHLRRSTPHLVSDAAIYQEQKNSDAGSQATNRHSATWCCGNFMLKQWKKMNNYDWILSSVYGRDIIELLLYI